MRIIVIGATGTIGSAVADLLEGSHEVLRASRRLPLHVDIAIPTSIASLFASTGPIDGVVCCAGTTQFGPLATLRDEDFASSIADKLMGQVNLTRVAFDHVRENGVVVLTSGLLSQTALPGSAARSMVNAALEGFTRAAALEAPRGIRVAIVSPGYVGRPDAGNPRRTPATVVAQVYADVVAGRAHGPVLPIGYV